ncbi:hypothetical protein ACFXJ8_18515 [Nonomuraea sp. NPDC059194]|uniref:hypothetical protein n=1 Tax=Nonomuraea sp. NPDC059194 TaxID=3346764 RepID=UPI0036871FA8
MEGHLAVRTPWRIAGLVARVLLLATLLWGMLLSVLNTVTTEGTKEELRAALHRPDLVVTVEDTGELRWSASPVGWRSLHPDKPGSMDAELSAAQARGVTVVRADRDRWPPDWFEEVPSRYGLLVPVAWFLTLLAMLASSRPRYASRLGWFWLFAIGGVGAPLYLLMEPQPIWAALDDPLPPRSSRLEGAGGCLVSIALGMVSGAAVLGLAALFS